MSKEPSTALLSDSELAQLLDIELLENHIQNKVIKRQGHPTLPLAILNYTQKCQFENLWDSVTMRCRGLIYDYETGDIVSVPFAKFFNYDTGDREETYPENLPTFEPEITKKMDGSLGILWRYGSEWGVATRGSFISDQAKWATKWLKDRIPYGWYPPLDYTFLFEIIYAENQIVVKYDQESIILIGCIDNNTGTEFKHEQLVQFGIDYNWNVVDKVNENLEELTFMDAENEEGYVATWHHEEGPPLKVKIKFATYFRLHRLLTGTSPKRIWEYLKDGLPLEDLVKDVPEHFKEWIGLWIDKLTDYYSELREEAIVRFETIGKFQPDRKTFALWATQPENKPLAPVLFKLLDNQRYDDIIWKLVKPLTENLGTFKSVDE